MPHSWENHKEPRYALPIPFAPGSHNVSDAYRANYDAVFGHRCNRLCESPCPDASVTRERVSPDVSLFFPRDEGCTGPCGKAPGKPWNHSPKCALSKKKVYDTCGGDPAHMAIGEEDAK